MVIGLSAGAPNTIPSPEVPWYCDFGWIPLLGAPLAFHGGCQPTPQAVTPPLARPSQAVPPLTENQLTNPTAYTLDEYYAMADREAAAQQAEQTAVRAVESGGNPAVPPAGPPEKDDKTSLYILLGGLALAVVVLLRK